MRKFGWHLPSSTGTGSYTTLVQNYVGREGNSTADNNHTIMQLNIFGFTSSGRYNSGGDIGNQSYRGFYLTSTANAGAIQVVDLDFAPDHFYPAYGTGRGNGLSLRCLAR